ncbi:MAG: WecB/TagA/CpsF family glycosyltransferase [Synechococcus sp.]
MTKLFGLPILDTTLQEVARRLIHDAQSGTKRKVFFINAHCVNVAARNQKYLDALQGANYICADGIGMKFAAQLAGEPLSDNVNGTDLFPLLCEAAVRMNIKIALLGAKPGVAERCSTVMAKRFHGLEILPIHHGYFKANEEQGVIKKLNNSGASILLLAKGVPEQELWISRNFEEIDIPVQIGVGALFDISSGDVPRAPFILRKLGLEWLHRLIQEPQRLCQRYLLGNPIFLGRAISLRLKGRDALSESSLRTGDRS